MINVLFVCTGNSCRSQMAEGWLRALGGERFGADSAGIEVHGRNDRAVAAMAEAGVDISAQASTLLSDEQLQWADLVVTVCGHADENCPMLPPGTRKEHWPLEDPARATGSEAEIRAVFRASVEELRARVADLISRLDGSRSEGEQS
jgi:arsenate reductase